jgi:ATP-dependent DNA helicase RecQ
LSVYGIGKHRSVDEWRGVARTLLHQGLIDETQDGYPVLSLNTQSGPVLRQERTVHMAAVKPKRARAGAANSRSGASAAPQGGALFEHLRALRKRLADENGLPPYVVFHDATLREMAARRPLTLNQFAELPGVGRAKLERYGDEFIAAVREHASRGA